MEFSKKLKQLRQKTNMSQDQLANILKVSFQTINRLESNKNKPRKNIEDNFNRYCEKENIIIEDNEYGIRIISAQQLKTIMRENKREAEGILPELIERLIIESNNTEIIERNFPKEDMINSRGVDGRLVAKSNNSFVPNGESFWERGTSTTPKDAKLKIESDLKKRTKDYELNIKNKVTFICVCVAVIAEKDKRSIIKEYEAKGWKKIIIYDLVDLETWLSYCFSTSAWLYERFYNKTLKIRTLNSSYKEMMELTKPKSTDSLYLADRSTDKEVLIDLIKQERNIINIVGPSQKETYGFVLACLNGQEEDDIKNRTIVVDNLETFEHIDKHAKKHIIVANFQKENSIICGQNIHVFICSREYINAGQYDIRLADRSLYTIQEILKKDMHVSSNEINEISKKANNNFLLLLRMLKNDNTDILVKWERKDVNQLIPILLLGKLDTENDVDMELLKMYSVDNTEKYCNELREWDKVDGSPLNIYDTFIKVNSRFELWTILRDKISKKTIDKICIKLKEIFEEKNSKYELEPDERYMANIYGKNWKYTDYQIESMFDCITLYSLYSNNQYYADKFIKELLENINSEVAMLTISDYFSEIVECSPNSFIEYVSKEVKKDNSLIYSLFEDDKIKDVLFSSSNSYKLIQALEEATYLEETTKKSIEALVEINLKKFNYKYSNNPKDSLINIFFYGNNNSCLSLEGKEYYIQELSNKYGKNIIDILIGILNLNSCYICGNLYKWRTDDRVHNYECTWNEVFNYLDVIVDETIRNIDDDFAKNNNHLILNLLDNVLQRNLKTSSIIKILNKIKEIYSNNFDIKIYKRIIIGYNSNNNEVKDKYYEVLEAIKPKDELKENIIYLTTDFNEYKLFNINVDDYKEKENIIINKQKEIFDKLIKKYGINKTVGEILLYSDDDVYRLNYLFEYQFGKEELIEVLDCLFRNNKLEIMGPLLTNNNKYSINYLKSMKEADFNKILKYLPKGNYDYITSGLIHTEEQKKIYYENSFLFDTNNQEEVNNFIKYNPMQYLECVAYRLEYQKWDINKVLDVLLSIKENIIKETHDLYCVKTILTKLDNNVNSRKLLDAEIRFLDCFNLEKIPNCLSDYLFKNPQDYFEIFESLKEKNERLFRLWYRINSSFRLPNDFYLHKNETNHFIESFKTYGGNEEDKAYIKQCLGSILARTRTKDDETFLPIEVRELIETYDDCDVNEGVAMGYFNSIGVRNVEDGSREKNMAEAYLKESKEICMRYPNTAKILKIISNNLSNTSKRDKLHWLEFRDII